VDIDSKDVENSNIIIVVILEPISVRKMFRLTKGIVITDKTIKKI